MMLFRSYGKNFKGNGSRLNALLALTSFFGPTPPTYWGVKGPVAQLVRAHA